MGWTSSTGENMKCVSYKVNEASVNDEITNSLQDFSSTMNEVHDVNDFIVNSNVARVSADAPYLYLTSTNSTSPNAGIRGNGSTWLFGYGGTTGSEDISIGTQDGSGQRTLTFATGGSAKMKILANGNVGIGTPDPGNYKLNVWGSIRAHAVVVNTTGADFVFDPTYKLRPLAEVETFIKQNKHLPNVAPAAEMQTNGVSMGEMQAKLLEKVEELTLYVIEKDKEIVSLKAEKDKQLLEQNKLISEQALKSAQLEAELQQLKAMIKMNK